MSELRNAIPEEYEVELHRCEADIMAIFWDLLENELIEVRDEPGLLGKYRMGRLINSFPTTTASMSNK